jgi:hypothetical protein
MRQPHSTAFLFEKSLYDALRRVAECLGILVSTTLGKTTRALRRSRFCSSPWPFGQLCTQVVGLDGVDGEVPVHLQVKPCSASAAGEEDLEMVGELTWSVKTCPAIGARVLVMVR